MEQLEPILPGQRILDIGAGISPLPVWLARRGCFVHTVDGHRITRVLPATDDWNGWGFLDYHELDERITSHNCPIQEFKPGFSFDESIQLCCCAFETRSSRYHVP